jgi:hypothetical protein
VLDEWIAPFAANKPPAREEFRGGERRITDSAALHEISPSRRARLLTRRLRLRRIDPITPVLSEAKEMHLQ